MRTFRGVNPLRRGVPYNCGLNLTTYTQRLPYPTPMNLRLPILATALAFAGTVAAQEEPQTILEIIQDSEDHTTLEGLVVGYGLGEAVAGLDGASVFAPTDSAFAAVDSTELAGLLADSSALRDLILYHVVDTTFGAVFPALGFTRSLDGNGNSVQVFSGDDGDDEGEDADPLVNDSTAVTPIMASNGMVYSVDEVLSPRSITETVVQSPLHATLASVVTSAELAMTLDTMPNLTVFAPTDSAFAGVPDSTLSGLTADPGGALTSVLTYHVVAAVLPADSVIAGGNAQVATLNGDSLSVTVTDTTIQVDSIDVIVADIYATNGIVHVIDGVLIPRTITSVRDVTSAAEVGIRVFPVPASGATTVTVPEALAADTELSIIDARGVRVDRRVLRGTSTSVDVSALNAGVYYFLFEATDGRAFVQPVSVR